MNADHLPPALDDVSDGRVALNAQLLKHLRKARGLSQEALAELCALRHQPVSIASIKRAETGKVVLYRTARHLASIFEVEVDALLDADTGQVQVPAPVRQEAPPTPEESLRYVVELHIPVRQAAAPALAAEVTETVRSFGGTLQSPMDNDGSAGLVAVFGLPQAFRSDAERCLRCALALSPLLLVLGARALTVRLGCWRDGLPDDTPLPDLPAPDPVLPGDARPVLVARPLLAQLGEQFLFSDSPDPGYLWLAGERPETQQQPLCGRVAETRQYRAVLDTVLDTGGAHVIYLRAMAGVGKTRLAAEFTAMARREGLSCHRCEVRDAGVDTWREPLTQLARSLFDVAEGGDAALAAAIDSGMAALGLDPESALFQRALLGARMGSADMSLYAAMSHAVREQGLAQALEQLVLARAAREPLLLLVEDVHWGDPYLFDALGMLLGATAGADIIWLLTSRIENDPLEASLRPHLYQLPVTVFELAPLSVRDAQALADQYPELDAAYRRRCLERAQGNPLFLTQLLASPDTHLPDSLKHLVQARLDLLPPGQQRTLRAAAVLGNPFELALLRELIGDADLQLDVSSRNALVRRAGQDAMAFVHDLVLHCVLDLTAPAERQRLHRAVAALLRERDPAASAHHLYRAGDPGAFEMMLRAIRDKLAVYDFESALALCSECSAHDSTRYSSFTLGLLKAHAIAGMGRTLDAKEAYEHALMLAGRPHEKIEAVIGLAATLNILEMLEEEEKLLDDTLPLARASNADAALAKLLHLKGNLYFPRGDFTECRRNHEQAVRHARASGAAETEARALSGMGDSYYAQGHMNRSHELFGQCIAMCEQHGFVGIEASNRAALGSTRLYLGRPQEALADALHSATLAHQVGNRRAEVFARLTAAWVLVAANALDQAQEEVGRALSLARAIQAGRFETFLMESQARISWQRGEHELAERQIAQAAADVQRLRLQRFIGPWVLGTQALFTSDLQLRQRALLQGAAYLTRDCLAHNAFRFYLSAAEVSLLAGDPVAADFYAEQLAGCASGDACTWTVYHVDLVRACASHLDSPGAATREVLRELHRRGQQYGFSHATPRLVQVYETL